MSARNVQSDTSRVIVKNPLLSAVAGSIDDFVNSSILLPAAAPVVVATPSPPPPSSLQPHGSKENRDATKSVIYGTEPPAALDSDKFSEISLDQSVDADTSSNQPQEYNPLQNLDTFYPVVTDEQQHQQRDENIFSPATAIKDSLSQLPGVLPGVASSVFSSFSSILKGHTSPHPPGKENYTTSEPTNYAGQLTGGPEINSVNPYPCFYDQSIHQANQQQSEVVPPVVPTFYSPTDPTIQRPEASLSPSSDGNLYRLKERKKLYAPIPGLVNNHLNPIASKQQPSSSPIQPPNPSASPAPVQPAATSQNSSFSISSFFSGAPLLDKVLPNTANINQESTQPFDYNSSQQSVASASQFFNPNQFAATDSQQQVPSSIDTFSRSSTDSPFIVSAPPLQTTSIANSQLPPPPPSSQTATITSFNLNPFQKSATQPQRQLPVPSSPPQIFNDNALPLQPSSSTQQASATTQPPENSAAPIAQFFDPNQFVTANLQQPIPTNSTDNRAQPIFESGETFHEQSIGVSAQPPPLPTSSIQQQPSPIASQQPEQVSPAPLAQFFNPNQFSSTNLQEPTPSDQPSQPLLDTPFNLPPSASPNSFNLNPYQKPATPLHPSASTSPALVQQSAIPPSYLPPNATPSVSYRLQGKPLYKQAKRVAPPAQPANQPLLFNPVTPQSVPTSNFQIFNPLVFDNTQEQQVPSTPVASPLAQIPNVSIAPSNPSPVVPISSSLPPPPSNTQIFSPSIPTAQTPPVQIASALTPTTQLPNIQASQPASVEPLPVSSFNPFSQPSPASDRNEVNQEAAVSQNPFHSNLFDASPNPVFNTEQVVPSHLNSFFGDADQQSDSTELQHSNIVQAPIENSIPIQSLEDENVVNTEIKHEPLETIGEPTIQNFFQPIPFNPFQQQTHTDFDLKNTEPRDNNANIENINTGIQHLTLDKENNFNEESVVRQPVDVAILKPIETSTFDPTSFFNNNPTDSVSQNPSNVSEFQIQNFFNEPPPLSETQENVQEKNFNFIRTNLLNKRIERIANAETASPETLSIASVIAEPASSAQSETSYIEPPTTDVTAQLVTPTDQSLQSNQDQADGINIYNWLNKQEPPNTMATTPNERTSTPTTSTSTNIAYRPVYKHWFYKTTSESKRIWTPFSFPDSMLLEEAFLNKDKEIVTTDGGRFDVNIPKRTRHAVYWSTEDSEVRRCSWFYKGVDFRLIPYEENVAEQLEEEYREASHTGEWQRKIPLTTGETVIFNGPSDILHFLQSQSTDGWNNAVNTEVRPRAVKRGTDEFTIEDGEPEQIDHLLFMVHGIGSACDLKFRKVEEVVDEFRLMALQLIQSHYRSSCDQGIVGRVEVLPISWHSELHSEESGIDEKLKSITLESIPKLRHFTNDTLLDILFYTSPVFCQQIIEAVSGNMNKCYAKFCERNPSFHGSVSVSGHSLGSVILFDLLQHQRVEIENSENLDNANHVKSPLKRHCSQQINYTIGNAGTGQPYITYPQLSFQPKHFFALGSPIGMFVTIRGIDALGLDFKLPTTEHFFNVFHPYDPVAYRFEALINSELQTMRPVLVPHHKGRKRMHLELRETVARVGADIKQKILQTLRSTIDTVYSYTTLHKGPNDTKAITQEVNKVIEEQLNLDELETSANTSSASSEIDTGETDLALGKINGGRRIDYVLQEAPLEIINEYLFALTSHVGYWSSEDATLFIMKEIYTSLGVQADSKIPQATMTIERPSPANSVKSSPTTSKDNS
ncbi:uncharacterized protein LOC116346973 isoform X2 [Contarinia nasturtii]|uniref:uncharacterized protein LOC116346973 isoform X2 n=1 Tax=Contarinia nasturtii TaxID=265458 RepID=UPI0012D44643|nr:uncharacterized protein LOC116346973 isoform X2 [Contarinia nasturtii]